MCVPWAAYNVVEMHIWEVALICVAAVSFSLTIKCSNRRSLFHGATKIVSPVTDVARTTDCCNWTPMISMANAWTSFYCTKFVFFTVVPLVY